MSHFKGYFEEVKKVPGLLKLLQIRALVPTILSFDCLLSIFADFSGVRDVK